MQTGLTATSVTQIIVFLVLTALIGVATYWKLRSSTSIGAGSKRDIYLAGGGLTWPFVAGSITLTNLSTDQLVGMNGNQMLLLAWWEIAGFAGLMILAFVFVPVYYRNNCTTVTELLERRYEGRSIRTLISGRARKRSGLILVRTIRSASLNAAEYSSGSWCSPLKTEVMRHDRRIIEV